MEAYGDQNEECLREAVEAISFDQIVSPLLSAHLRCASHTLNLVSTTDLIKGIESHDHLQLLYKDVLQKCKELWQSARSPTRYEKIEKALEKALKRPIVTRWNSLFDCLEQIVELQDKLVILSPELGIADPLRDGDFR